MTKLPKGGKAPTGGPAGKAPKGEANKKPMPIKPAGTKGPRNPPAPKPPTTGDKK